MQLPPKEGLVKGLTMVGPFFAVLLEFVGEFDLAINKFWYFIFSKFSVQLKKIYRLIKVR